MWKMKMSRTLTISLTGALYVAWMAGCGGRVEVVPVKGRVTFDGEQVPADGALYFQPLQPAEKYQPRPGSGLFDQEGYYEAKTGTKNGVVPGQYQVHVECWKSPPNMEGKPVISYLPEKYQSAATSGLTLEVSPNDKKVEFNVDILTTE